MLTELLISMITDREFEDYLLKLEDSEMWEAYINQEFFPADLDDPDNIDTEVETCTHVGRVGFPDQYLQ